MLTLVIGGAASGKSEYAESLVLRSTLPRYYLATMQVWDAECAARVEKHRRMRAAKQFETVECPLHLDAVHLPARGTALLEDLGNLTANELYDPAGAGPQTAQAILSGLDAVYAQCRLQRGVQRRGRLRRRHRPLSAGAGAGEQYTGRPGRRRGAGGVRHPCLL